MSDGKDTGDDGWACIDLAPAARSSLIIVPSRGRICVDRYDDGSADLHLNNTVVNLAGEERRALARLVYPEMSEAFPDAITVEFREQPTTHHAQDGTEDRHGT